MRPFFHVRFGSVADLQPPFELVRFVPIPEVGFRSDPDRNQLRSLLAIGNQGVFLLENSLHKLRSNRHHLLDFRPAAASDCRRPTHRKNQHAPSMSWETPAREWQYSPVAVPAVSHHIPTMSERGRYWCRVVLLSACTN